MAENLSAKDELEDMVALYNEAGLGSDRELVVDLRTAVSGRGAIVSVVLRIDGWKKPPILAWGGAPGPGGVEAACAIALGRLKAGSAVACKYLPFTASSLEELKLKLAILGGEGMLA